MAFSIAQWSLPPRVLAKSPSRTTAKSTAGRKIPDDRAAGADNDVVADRDAGADRRADPDQASRSH